MSEDMSPYSSGHDEWLIMKLCMYVGYHDANNVSNFAVNYNELCVSRAVVYSRVAAPSTLSSTMGRRCVRARVTTLTFSRASPSESPCVGCDTSPTASSSSRHRWVSW